jgi:hypothetical protein
MKRWWQTLIAQPRRASCLRTDKLKSRPSTRLQACLPTRLNVEELETRVCPAISGNNWMSGVPDGISLFQMSLPGTHDSMSGSVPFTSGDLQSLVDNKVNTAVNGALGNNVFSGALDAVLDGGANALINATSLVSLPLEQMISQTQNTDLTTQLSAGVRVLDIRVQQDNNQLELVHGGLPLSPLVFDSAVLQPVTNFLAANPSEAIVIQVQVDSTSSTPGNGTVDQIFGNYESETNPGPGPAMGQPYGNYIWQATPTEPVPPTLGAARGKIVIIQSNGIQGLQDTGWNPQDPNFPNSFGGQTSPPPEDIFDPIQNDFKTDDLASKSQEAENLVASDAQHIPAVNQPNTLSTFSANYLSASSGNLGDIFTTPYAIPFGMATGASGTFDINAGNIATDVGLLVAAEANTFPEIAVPALFASGLLQPVVQWTPTPGGSGVGMNSLLDNYINTADPPTPITDVPAPLGIVFTDFAVPNSAFSAPPLIQDIYLHNPFPISLSANGTLTLDTNLELPGAHTITIGQVPTGQPNAGGVEATIDGQTQTFPPDLVTSIVVMGGASSNTVDIQAIAAGVASINVQGDGDATTLEAPSGTANVWHLTSAGGGTIDVGSQDGIVTFSGVTNLSGGGGDDFIFEGGGVSGNIDGGSGTSTLDYSNLAGPVTVNLQTDMGSQIGGTFANIGNFVGSQSTADTFIGPDSGATWDITGANSGTVNGSTFSSFENLTGGLGNDQFVFFPGGSASGNIDGGGGTNTLDYSNLSTSVTITLPDMATGIGGIFTNISVIKGGSGTNSIVGANANTVWTLTGLNTFTVDGLSVSGFQSITGGSGNDRFVFLTGGGVSGSINGAGGVNTLDYSQFVGGITVNLTIGKATGVGQSVSNIQNVTGSIGNDLIVGNAQANTLIGGTGRNVIIGGGGSDNITGGGGDNILIGGTTAWDANPTALAAIMAEWTRTDLSFEQRLADLNSDAPPSRALNGTYELNKKTVFDDGLADTLTGGGGLDWFFYDDDLDTLNSVKPRDHKTQL